MDQRPVPPTDAALSARTAEMSSRSIRLFSPTRVISRLYPALASFPEPASRTWRAIHRSTWDRLSIPKGKANSEAVLALAQRDFRRGDSDRVCSCIYPHRLAHAESDGFIGGGSARNKSRQRFATRSSSNASPWANDELLAYIQSPAGAKFPESSPITLDADPRRRERSLGRILWTIQAVVLLAGGAGLLASQPARRRRCGAGVSRAGYPRSRAGTPGFVISAIISFMISRHLGLVEIPQRPYERRA